MIDLLIKYPTRSRPDLFKKIITEYVSKLSGKLKVKFIVSMDSDDQSCNNNDMLEFLNYMKSKIDLDYYYGKSNNKIEACNRDVPSEGWKICLLVSDDMTPRVQGFDKIIMDDMCKYFPDFDGALNYNCGGHAFPKVMVLSVIGNPYYKRFNYIYHPDYTSLFCDEEQTDIARSLNKIVDINHKIITHDWNNIKDDLRKHTEKYYQSDKIIFENRKIKGFPI
jgi:hypothetical protein